MSSKWTIFSVESIIVYQPAFSNTFHSIAITGIVDNTDGPHPAVFLGHYMGVAIDAVDRFAVNGPENPPLQLRKMHIRGC